MTDFENMTPALASALAAKDYKTLTPVQLAMLSEEAANADLLVSAQTGSGKTVAFGIAIANTLLGDAEKLGAADLPLALVIAPTRELAMQVSRELEWLYAKAGAKIATCVGGMEMRKERRVLEQGAHIVVGTPGRLRDHITRGSLDISALRAVVLDEADEMLDLGFREDLEFILAAAPAERRTLMFSATVPKQIALLAKRFQRDAVRITAAGDGQQHGDIEYQLMLVAPPDRENAIINTLLFVDAKNTIVFCHTREAVKHLASRLANRGFAVVALSGELSQAERTNALQSMRDGRARVCVATDVAARGIDLPNLDLVIHADMPTNPDTLLHRSGRTGRAGRKGTCALIVPHHRRGSAARVLKMAKLEAVTISAPTGADIEARNRQRILEDPSLSEAPNEDELTFVQELMAAHSIENIAAAYLRREIAARPAPEELVGGPIREYKDRNERTERPERDHTPTERFSDGVWFRVSVGRKHRAEPRWLLPMICKAGHITKREVGSIKIQESESHFEIITEKAEAFAAAVKKNSAIEKGVTISRLEGGPPKEAPARSGWNADKKGKFKPKDDRPAGPTVEGGVLEFSSDQPKKVKTKPRWKKSKPA
ncbi:DEAD/DEAH box helicase [Mesorhizobium sp. NBSH29]|uniref:DEAD/DEAH box helicase n=1 Tax=Mesorhizobium sp. NBSH29 TaxID=2654249 RepID=UPI0018964A65|nr:DEAD/DEAH box helicase [Mesorhizobium sp. NBSH29]QPC88432.1 DEAD/DEAH box helicase [Mesorhizobium sp. NBSH29]